MTATGGFDLVIEIGPDALRDAIRANVELHGVKLNPPFDLQQRINVQPPLGPGLVSLLVNDLKVSLEDAQGVRITMPFADSCIENDNLAGFTAYHLAGEIILQLKLQMVDAGPMQKTLGFDPTATRVTLNFTPSSRQTLQTALTNAGVLLSLDAFIASAQAQLKGQLGSATTPIRGFSFVVTPGTNGGLFPTLQFERLELHNIGTGALGIFGSCLTANHSAGDPASMTARPFAPGQNVRMTLAASAFHTLAFCPGMATRLGTAPGAVPGSCGGGGPVAYGPGEMLWINDRFEPGAIVVNGKVRKSDDGCLKEATVEFTTRFPVSIVNGNLAIGPGIPSFGEPDVTVYWYCEVGAVILGGPLGIAAIAIGREVVEDIAGDAVSSAITSLLRSGPGGGSGFSLPNSRFSTVEMTPEAMTIAGATRFSIAPPDPPRLWLTEETRLIPVSTPDNEIGVYLLPNPLVLMRGNIHIKHLCIDGVYPVLERYKRLESVVTLETYRIPRPIARTLSLESWDVFSQFSTPTLLGTTPLPAVGAGDLEIPAARCKYPFPLMDGTVVNQPVSVQYTVNRGAITLRNDPDHGCYGLSLRMRVTNAAGLNEVLSTGIAFAGNDVEILGTYEADYIRCVGGIIAKGSQYVRVREPRPWEPIEGPRPEEHFAYLTVVRPEREMAEATTLVAASHAEEWLAGTLAAVSTPVLVMELETM